MYIQNSESLFFDIPNDFVLFVRGVRLDDCQRSLCGRDHRFFAGKYKVKGSIVHGNKHETNNTILIIFFA